MHSKEIKFLLTHSSIYGVGTIITRLVSFILLPLYTRYLSPEDYGIIETIDVSVSLIGIVATVGITLAVSRFYYEPESIEGRNTVVSTSYITYFFITLFLFPVLYYSCNPISFLLFNTDTYSDYFHISFIALLLGGFIDIGLVYLRLIKKPKLFISITLSRLILIITLNIVFIVHFELGILGILYSKLIVRILYSLLITSSILYRVKIKFDKILSIAILKYSLPIIPSRLANTLVKQSDKYFILYFLSVADMGIYSLALKLGNAVHTLLTIPFNLVYIPRRFELMNKPDASVMFSNIFFLYFLFVGFIGLCISLLIPEILIFMVTPKFYSAGEIIPLVVLSMIIFGTHNHFNFGILFSKKTQYMAYINLFSALISLFANYFLIKQFGIFGAVLASITALSIQSIFLLLVSNHFFPIDFHIVKIISYIGIGISYFYLVTSLNFDHLVITLFYKIFSILVFPFVLCLFRIIKVSDLRKLKDFAMNMRSLQSTAN